MQFIKNIINSLADPRLFFLMSVAALVLMIWKREAFSQKAVGYGLLGFLALFLLFGYFDPNFQLIILKPDNVPIVGLIFLIVFFTWYSIRQGVINDQRIARGDGPVEKQESDRVWVWPDLVYTELISLILCSVVLIFWSILLKAPIEQPASASVTPNPSKAPWYFLGLQELVSFSAFMGGIGIPAIVLVGLALIPYLDRETEGTGRWFGGPGGGRLVAWSAAFGLAAVLALETFAIRFGWIREWWPDAPQLLVTAVNPGTVLTLVYALYSMALVRRYASCRAGALGLFTCFLAGFLVLTIIGTYFRGPNWAFYWSPAHWPGH